MSIPTTTLRKLFPLIRQAASEWVDDNAPSRAASLSYYTVFSIAPLLIIAVAVAGFVFGRRAASGELSGELRRLLGAGGAQVVEGMMASASKDRSGALASVLGLVVLAFGACGAFVELQSTLDVIWGVERTGKTAESKTSAVLGFIRSRLLSFAMIGVIAFLLLASLVASAALAALGHFANGRLPAVEGMFHVVNFIGSFAVTTVLFAAIFKVLPDAKIAWRDVWLGAAATSLLFVAGKLLIGLYLGKSGVASTYAAAGSFAVLLLWIYYSAMIVFFGAELTQVFARAHGTLRNDSTGVAKNPASRREAAPADRRLTRRKMTK